MHNNRLSHSSINKYLFCAESWRLHYVERIRPFEVGSALPFGSALGKTFEHILNNFIDPTQHTTPPKEVFDNYWNQQEINGELTDIKTYPYIAYSKYDSDYDLLTKRDFAEAAGNQNIIAWLSLKAKGHLIIDSFIKNFLPLVEHVYSLEEKIELDNGEGDSSIGFADCVVKLKGYDKPIVMDFKTAAWEYEPDAVQKSVQLSQYMHVLGEKYNTRLAGYAVFLKNIEKNRSKICKDCKFDGSAGKFKTCNNEIKGKRCNGDWIETLKPECKMQLVIDELPQATEDFIISNIENVNNAIKTGIFTKNINGCWNNGYNRPCEFVNLCWKNDMSKYVKLEEKKNET